VESIRVLLVDDHVVLREGLAGLLGEEADLDVVGRVGSCAEAVSAAAALDPHVVVLDHRLPDGDGVRATQAVLEAQPHARVVMFTATDDPRLRANAAAAGCLAFVVKTAEPGDVIDAIRAAALGENWGCHDASTPSSALSARELDLLDFAARGFDNQTIAAQLFLSVNTVRNHFQRILAKLDAHSKLEAVAVAGALGLLNPPTL